MIVFSQVFGGRKWSAGAMSPSGLMEQQSVAFSRQASFMAHSKAMKKKSSNNLQLMKVHNLLYIFSADTEKWMKYLFTDSSPLKVKKNYINFILGFLLDWY